jgi:hypothetical protein
MENRQAMTDGNSLCFKPYWGNPAIRNFRGDSGNLEDLSKAPQFYSTGLIGEFRKPGLYVPAPEFYQ